MADAGAGQLPPADVRVVYDEGGVRIHTFVSPEPFLANATHIIEGPHSLVVVDGQFVVPYATQFRAYADGLGKPIDRVYLSHAHVDHFFGLASWADTQIYAPAATIRELAEHGEALREARAKEYGPFVPAQLTLPQHEVVDGTEVIDGITFELATVTNAECATQLTIRLPELGVYVAQDLVYSGTHLYITRTIDSWVQALEAVLATGDRLVLAGHGPAAGPDEVNRNIEYLRTAAKVLEESPDPETYRAAILAAYPDCAVPGLLDIYIPRLFGTATE